MADTVNIEGLEPANQAETVTATANQQTPGQMLREARFAQDQSEAQVATRLYLSRSVVRFIENDQYDKLPGTTFVRGYLRSYARLVNVPGDKVMEAFDALGVAKEHAPMLAPITRVKKEVSVNDSSIRWVTYLIIATLIGLVVVWWRSHSEKIEDVVADPATTTSATATAADDNVAPAVAAEPVPEPIVGTDVKDSLDNKVKSDGAEKVMNSDQLRDNHAAPKQPTRRNRRQAEAEQVLDSTHV